MSTAVLEETPKLKFQPRKPLEEELAAMYARPLMITGRWATYSFFVKFMSPLMMDRMTDKQIEGLVTKIGVSYPPGRGQRTQGCAQVLRRGVRRQRDPSRSDRHSAD